MATPKILNRAQISCSAGKTIHPTGTPSVLGKRKQRFKKSKIENIQNGGLLAKPVIGWNTHTACCVYMRLSAVDTQSWCLSWP